MNRIDDAPIKARLVEYLERIGAAWKRGNERESWYVCPLHQEKTASFHVTPKGDGDVFKCMGCGAGGTVLDLHAMRCGLSLPGDYLLVVEGVAAVLGARVDGVTDAQAAVRQIEKPESPAPRIALPDDARGGTLREWQEMARLRKISAAAAETAARLGTLFFATVAGFPCWLITDESRRCVEARRMDGQFFPAIGDLGERKTHTLRGSKKGWPVGLHIRGFQGDDSFSHLVRASDFRALLAVEGQPDYFAGLHFVMTPCEGVARSGCGDCLPIAFLGASNEPQLSPEDRALIRGRHVRFYPHRDGNGSGASAVVKWARKLADAGATVDAFSFEGLRKQNGQPVKDLNDCTDIHAEDAPKLYDLLP